jgi:hypothetical protein
MTRFGRGRRLLYGQLLFFFCAIGQTYLALLPTQFSALGGLISGVLCVVAKSFKVRLLRDDNIEHHRGELLATLVSKMDAIAADYPVTERE